MQKTGFELLVARIVRNTPDVHVAVAFRIECPRRVLSFDKTYVSGHARVNYDCALASTLDTDAVAKYDPGDPRFCPVRRAAR